MMTEAAIIAIATAVTAIAGVIGALIERRVSRKRRRDRFEGTGLAEFSEDDHHT
jgi:hypothetical protein